MLINFGTKHTQLHSYIWHQHQDKWQANPPWELKTVCEAVFWITSFSKSSTASWERDSEMMWNDQHWEHQNSDNPPPQNAHDKKHVFHYIFSPWQGSCWSKLTFCRSRNTPSFIAFSRTPSEKVMSEFPLRINDLHLGGTASTCVNLFNAKSKATKEGAVALPSRWPVRPELTAWRLPREVQCWKDLRSSETSLLMGHLVRSRLVNFGIQLCFSPVSSCGGLKLTLLPAKLKSCSSWQHPFQVPSGWPATPVPERSTNWISFQLNMVEMSPETLVPDTSKCFNLVLLRKRVMSPEALDDARCNLSKPSNSPKRSSSAPFTWLLWLPKSSSVTWQFLLGDMGKSLSSKKNTVWLLGNSTVSHNFSTAFPKKLLVKPCAAKQ